MTKTNFREFNTSSGKLVLAGRDEESNESLVRQVKHNELVFHTKSSGSPFANLKCIQKEASKKDIEESALFCAVYSRDWKKNKKNLIIHMFIGKDIYKKSSMKKGTFGVKDFKEIKLNKEELNKFEKQINLDKEEK